MGGSEVQDHSWGSSSNIRQEKKTEGDDDRLQNGMVAMKLSGLRNRWKPKHQTEIQGPGKESVGMHSGTSIC